MNQTESTRFIRIVSFVVNKLWLLFATLVVVTALLFSLIRFALPQIGYYKSDIEQWIEKEFSLQVTIDSLNAEWNEEGPTILIQGVELKSDDGQLDLIELARLKIKLDALQSIVSRRLITSTIAVDGLTVNFLLDRQLAVRLDAIESEEDQTIVDIDGTSSWLLETLFSQKQVTVTNSKASLETISGRRFEYELAKLDIKNFASVHQLSGRLNDPYGGHISLVAEIFGDPSNAESYTNLFLESEGVALNRMPLPESYAFLKPSDGQVEWRLWADWRKGRWQSVVGDVKIENIEWDSTSGSVAQKLESSSLQLSQEQPVKSEDSLTEPDMSEGESQVAKSTSAGAKHNDFTKQLSDLAFNYRWQFQSDRTGILSVFDTRLSRNRQSVIELSPIEIEYRQSNNGDLQWQLMSHQFNAAPLIEFAVIPMLAKIESTQTMEQAKVSLNFDALGMRFVKRKDRWLTPVFYTQFDSFNLVGLSTFPNATNLKGEISFADGIGRVELQGENAQLSFGELFRQPLSFESLDIDAYWKAEPAFDLRIKKANLNNEDLKIRAKTRFFTGDEQDRFSLYAELHDVDVGKKSLYLPTGIMQSSLVDYLDESVKSGKLPLVKTVVRGPLPRFPYPKTGGIFSVLGHLEDTQFKYLPDWPEINQLSAKLLFEGNGMDLLALGGFSDGVVVNQARAKIEEFAASPLQLDIDANAKGNSGQQFLLDSPLSDLGNALMPLQLDGWVNTKIKLDVDLSGQSEVKVTGKVNTQGLESVSVGGFQFDTPKAEIEFNERGIAKTPVLASYFGHDIEAEIVPGESTQEPQYTIYGKGKVGNAALANLIGERWANFSTGEAEVNALVRIGLVDNEDTVQLEFQSDLEGLAINLPGKLSKLKSQKSSLEAVVTLSEISSAKISWREFSGQWWWSQNSQITQQRGGYFELGPLVKNVETENKSNPTRLDKYQINAQFDNIVLSEWEPVFEQIYAQHQQAIVQSEDNLSQSLEPLPIEINVMADRIVNEYAIFNSVVIKGERQARQPWRYLASGPFGQVDLRLNESKPWELKVENLNLELAEKMTESIAENIKPADKDSASKTLSSDAEEMQTVKEQSVAGASPLMERFSLADWPSMSVLCSNCRVDGINFGDAKFELVSGKNQLSLSGVVSRAKHHELEITANWFQSIEQNKVSHRTELAFGLNSGNIGRLLNQFKYESGVKESSARITGRMNWPDVPWKLNILQANGAASFRLNKGYLTEVSDAKARLFSLLSLQTLSRRLKLDFSDVFKKGFFYDRISGEVTLDDRKLYTHRIYVDGNAAKVTLQGLIDLENNQMDQNALVLPQLTSSLPVLVGWAVEPTTGILVYLLNKLIEPAIEVVTQIEYRIYGPLDNVSVDEVKKSKSKVKYEVDEATNDTSLDAVPSSEEQQPKSQTPIEN